MKFSGHTIPEAVFTMARERMRSVGSFTPPELRAYIVEHAAADLATVTAIDVNCRIIAERVMRAVIKELVAAGELVQLKRGVWMKKSIVDNAVEYVIYAKSESSDEPTFWSNEDGWGGLTGATRFKTAERMSLGLPMSSGLDAEWMLLEEARDLVGQPA